MPTLNTIENIQNEIETALENLPRFQAQLPDALKPLAKLASPTGLRVQVSLRHAKSGRQVKRNAPADSWSPESGLVSISYNPALKEAELSEGAVAPPQDSLSGPEHRQDPVKELVLALARAQRDPQLGFISLKWFRDGYLLRQGYAWAAAPENRQQALVEAINRKWVLTSKVANPKNPQFPVTAIKLNQSLPEVRKLLEQESEFGSMFAPISIAGEPLSETVLRDRR